MIAAKSGRKNPTMGQIDATVVEAGARQAYEAAVETGLVQALPEPPPPPKYSINIDARKVTAAPVLEAGQPVGLLGMVKRIPWYGWVALATAGLFITAVISDASEKKSVKKNRAERDPDLEDEDEDLEEDEDDPDSEDEEDLDDDLEEDEAEDNADGDRDDLEDDEDYDDEEESEAAPEDEVPPARQRRPATRTSKSRKRTARVIADNQPEQEPVESVVGDGGDSESDTEAE